MLVVDAMKRFLKPGDTFIDVGANVGYLSAVAAGLVGMHGEVHSFEPVPVYFAKLRRLAELNPEFPIHANSCAAGEIAGAFPIYVTQEPGQNTFVPSYKTGSEIVQTVEVPVVRLDAYIAARNLRRVSLIKIDAEGFELPILKGLQGYFESTDHRPAIICEIAPRAYPLLGRSLWELAAFMAGYGYFARDLIDGTTRVDLCAMRQVEDVLFRPGACDLSDKHSSGPKSVASSELETPHFRGGHS
jgi:FkbM family methyltransferase